MNATLALTAVLADCVSHLPPPPLAIPTLIPAVMGLDRWGLPAQDKPIWLGILVPLTIGTGFTAPPVGLIICVVTGIARDVSMNPSYRGAFPFLAWDALRLMLLLPDPVRPSSRDPAETRAFSPATG